MRGRNTAGAVNKEGGFATSHLKNKLKAIVPRELRHLRWGDRDPLRRRAWKLLAVGRPSGGRALYHSTETFFDDPFSMHADKRVAAAFAGIVSHQKTEGVWALDRPALIEPTYGWIVANTARLVDDCLIDAWARPRPSVRDYFAARRRPHASITIPEVIHLRDPGEANYYHVLNDLVGGRLRLAEACGIPETVPLLVSKKLLNSPFFQDLLKESQLGRRQFVVQEQEYVRSGRTFYFQTHVLSVQNAQYVTRLLGVQADPKGDRRILLTRGKREGRGLTNAVEVENLCTRYGFEAIDPGTMSLREQADLFSRARYVVGTHGAGLFNMIFRQGAPLSLVEIQPPLSYGVPDPRAKDSPYAHFFWLCHAMGFRYDFVMGHEVEGVTPSPYSVFAVDVSELEVKLRNMLAG